jgi:hypothetical protein
LIQDDWEVYEGEWKRDKKNGFGVEEINYDGERYEGNFVDGCRGGRGVSY